MLQEAWGCEKLTYRGLAKELDLSHSMLQGWIEGRTVPTPEREPGFRSVVARLKSAPGAPAYADVEWEAALRAAQQEARSAQHGQSSVYRRPKDPGLRFIGLHCPAPRVSAVEARLRKNERTVMTEFVRDSRPGAPSYLCWCADGPVGKTMLLAGYIRQKPPTGVDILTFFVSAAHGAHTRAEFENEIAGQIGRLLDDTEGPVPRGTRAWNALFAKAADKSAEHGRSLLLVVDGLDDDAAWSGGIAGSGWGGKDGVPQSGPPFGEEPQGRSRGVRRSVRGSIAALLPSLPPPNMRIIVSLRRWAPLPGDVPEKRHPLRQIRHLRTLLPVAGMPQLRHPRPDATALGEPVAGLLAVANGGLRTADLAELTGLPADHLDRLVQGPTGRALVTEDPVLGTYALADPHLVRAVREGLGQAEVLRYTEELLAWSRRWRDVGWPDGTPPYPLTYQLRLLTGAAERTAYVLDVRRLHQLARTAGPDVPLTQLDAFEQEISAAPDAASGAERMATLVALSGARSILRRAHGTHVPDGAAALYVRLGDTERARGLARSAPTALDRAVHLVETAVELAYAGQTCGERAALHTDAVVQEAVEWLARDRADQGFPGALRDSELYARLLCAAAVLARLNGPDAARPVFRAVLQDPAAGTAAITEAAGRLDAVMGLHYRAETFSAGGLRARTVAVELYGALAQVAPHLGSYAGDRVEALCEELGDTEGLSAVDVLAAAASMLVTLPAKRHRRAVELLQAARARMRQALEALEESDSPADALSEADRAHLRRELSGTLRRLVEATVAMKEKGDRDGIRRQMEAVPEDQRIGVLGDPLPERAHTILDAEEKERARRADEAAREAAERRDAERKTKRSKADAERAALNRQRASRGARVAEAPQPAPTEPRDASPFPPPRRSNPHRRSTGLLRPGDGPHPDRPEQPLLLRLLEVDDQVRAGDLLRGRELLEAVLRSRPATRPVNSRHLPEGWTVELCQAMGAAGVPDQAEALVEHLPDTYAQARHLAALSLGASLAGHENPGARYARAAARLVPAGAAPELANAVAQALAHTGDEAAATAMAAGGTRQRQQALTAVATGLVRHSPEAAARVAEPLVEVLARRMERGDSRTCLPELAALLLAFPDARNPSPRLSDVLGRAALRVADPSTAASAGPMAVLALLERLHCLPDEAVTAVEGAVGRWQHARQMEPQPSVELAILAAVNGDTIAVRRHAAAARTPDDRVMALGAAAAYLVGAQAALAADSGAHDRVVRTCLALAGAVDRGSPPCEEAARDITLELLRYEEWTRTILLLPTLAPGALGHLGAMAGA
ncbi:hypothetical protein ACIQ9E_06425 [Streptomyces sp. NPDC094448]|uniref:hypothetical protein n=1 Tax=Streptomyces sp. NPDC094448 TaxID=3366063 RepID=UPI0037FDDF0F